MGRFGADVVPAGARILTHCNAGALATAGYGTALGVIRAAAEQGKVVQVFADETRPFMQGARLTAWELVRDQVPTTVIAESMAGPLMRQGGIDMVVVGADRIAANGDVANKIGTYTVATMANARILTYCNTGALATAGHGTALGVVRSAKDKGVSVIACETRPYLQGARLTAWECMQESLPCTLVTDNMAGHLMSRGEVDLVVVGADRIAANGDVANKIGTYTLAVLARRHGLPFYVAAPLSTFDAKCADGSRIPIEERPPAEVTGYRGMRWAPEGVAVRNPAFDVTPAELITAIICEKGVVRAPSRERLQPLISTSA